MRHEQLRGLLSLSGVCGTPVTLVEEGCSPLLVLAHRAAGPGDGTAGQCRACAEQGWGFNVCFYEDAVVLLAVNNWPQFLDACPRRFCMQVSSRCCLRYTGMTWRCSGYYWLWCVCNNGTQSWVDGTPFYQPLCSLVCRMCLHHVFAMRSVCFFFFCYWDLYYAYTIMFWWLLA